ncbi:hypothetical protein KIL84_012893 [Mauremys mutica]|uniref:Uncharacterized protein n=1 Tax=Mauremys mutica TaxID=74926 RepID=A0A9D3XSD9_9SAUR|nr:hypothetical protein KIL84_012893 [Mauremys mutica]
MLLYKPKVINAFVIFYFKNEIYYLLLFCIPPFSSVGEHPGLCRVPAGSPRWQVSAKRQNPVTTKIQAEQAKGRGEVLFPPPVLPVPHWTLGKCHLKVMGSWLP